MAKHKAFQRSRRGPGGDDPGRARSREPSPGHLEAQGRGGAGGRYWIYGQHAVGEALANPTRRVHRIVTTGEALPSGARPNLPAAERLDRAALERLLPAGAVHQGLAARVDALAEVFVEDLLENTADQADAIVVVLDQVTDPQNVGAVLRSAAAFGARTVVLPERHAAPESGALAKAASGALEHVPVLRVPNLARALDQLKKAGFWVAGLAAEADRTLAEASLRGRIALVLGAEGSGLRRLTRDSCDMLVRLPTSGPIGHLNVSNAAAVALYELARAAPATAGSSGKDLHPDSAAR